MSSVVRVFGGIWWSEPWLPVALPSRTEGLIFTLSRAACEAAAAAAEVKGFGLLNVKPSVVC